MKDRLQKKCIAGSALFHGMLVFVLLFGVAFGRPSAPKEKDLVPMTLIDISRLKPEMITDGPSRAGNSAPPQVQPQPQPAPQPAPPPEPKVEQPKPVRIPDPPAPKPRPAPQPEKVETPLSMLPDNNKISVKEPPKKDPKKPHEIIVNTREVVDTKAARLKQAAKQAEEDRKKQEAEDKAYREALNSAREAVHGIAHESASTIGATGAKAETVSISGGGSGPSAANYRDVVFNYYFRAWIAPEDVASTEKNVVAKVIVSRDGTIVSARISKRSGNDKLDRSVQHALDAVDHLPAFPPDSSDSERTFNITFNLEAKRSLG